MSISDRLLGKKNVNGKPHIEAVTPNFALPGGEVRIIGKSLRPPELRRPSVHFGEIEGSVLIGSDDFVVARVPDGAISGPVTVSTDGSSGGSAGGHISNPHSISVAVPVADNLHPVTNPALDREGNIYVTFSGSRGQKVPVAIFKIDTNYNVKPFLSDMMNATSIAFDREGQMYVSSRHDEAVYQVAPNGTVSTYAEGMGVATGIAFDTRGESLRRRPQWNHFQDRSRPANFCFRHAGAERFRLSPRLRSAWRYVRHRPQHFQLRLRL